MLTLALRNMFCLVLGAVLMLPANTAPILFLPGTPMGFNYFPAPLDNATFTCSSLSGYPYDVQPGTRCVLPEGGVALYVGKVPATPSATAMSILVTTPTDSGVFYYNGNVTSGANDNTATCMPTSTTEPSSSFLAVPCTRAQVNSQFPNGTAQQACAQLAKFNSTLESTTSTNALWRLPRGGELMMLYAHRDKLGGFIFDITGSAFVTVLTITLGTLNLTVPLDPNSQATYYWAAEELETTLLGNTTAANAWRLNMGTGLWTNVAKNTYHPVRCVRLI